MAKTMKKDKKEAFLEQYEKSLAVISTACKCVNITRQTFYNWCSSDPEFNEKVKEIEALQIDFVESKLIENIRENDTTAIIFYLKTKAKDRGYTERIEVEKTGQDLFMDLMIAATSGQ